MNASAFEVNWSEADMARLFDRVADTALPPAPAGAGWTFGCDAEFLARLKLHWTNTYDWRAAQSRLNRYPQFLARIGELDIHFVHVRGEGATARPLLLTHGWPGSHVEFWKVIEPLAFPSRFGGRAEDAFDVVVPSLPGFGFSGKPAGPLGQRATAALWNRLMTEVLGYASYLAQGGDWGALVTSWLGLDHAASVRAIHLNMLGFRSMQPPRDEAEGAWLKASEGARQTLGAYAALQMTKPQSLAWAAADNPLGQAAWIVERFHDWSDLRTAAFEDVFNLDDLITNVMIYATTGSFATAAWYYVGVAMDGFAILPADKRCETPTCYASYPGDRSMPAPPRSRAELVYNLTRWSEAPSGGHFAAFENPQFFVDDVRAWARELP